MIYGGGSSIVRIDVHTWAMRLAKVTAQRATCLRRAVGCVLLDQHNHVLATGYNGVAAGQPHCNEETGFTGSPPGYVGAGSPVFGVIPAYSHACLGAFCASGVNLDGCHAIHAEQNALLQCRDVHAIAACYATTAPCITCTKLLLNTGCQSIYYMDDYPQAGVAKMLWDTAGRRPWVRLE